MPVRGAEKPGEERDRRTRYSTGTRTFASYGALRARREKPSLEWLAMVRSCRRGPHFRLSTLSRTLGLGQVRERERGEERLRPKPTDDRPADDSTVRGYRRVFKHVAPIFLERGIAIRETMEMASLSVEEGCDEDAIVVSLFDMKASEVPAFISREEVSLI